MRKTVLTVTLLAATLVGAHANERVFTYTYEPEVLPQSAVEFEQWLTLRSGRAAAAGKGNFNRWDIREELEYGVTDRYTASLYLNFRHDSFVDLGTGHDQSVFKFEGVALENRYQLLNPAEHCVGLTLYLEPRLSQDEASLEQKIILGQRIGDWKWALNLSHETEWNLHHQETEAEFEATFGLSHPLGKRWSLGAEARLQAVNAEYERWENVTLSLGPTLQYRQERWWAALTVLPQLWGHNCEGNPDGKRYLDLDDHERVEIRLLVGIGF
jgi:hypothetical protein